MPRAGIEPGSPGSVIERHNHEAKRSGPVRLVIYAPYIFTNILIICTSLCRATTLLHPTMKHLYQMFSTIPRLFCDSVAIARLQIQGYLVRSPVGALDGNIFFTGLFLLLLHFYMCLFLQIYIILNQKWLSGQVVSTSNFRSHGPMGNPA